MIITGFKQELERERHRDCYVAGNSSESQVLIPQMQESLHPSFPRARDIDVRICISYSIHVDLGNMHLIEEALIRYSWELQKLPTK